MSIENADRVYRDFDVEVGQIVKKARRRGLTIPCKSGCDACCSDIAIITSMEAEILVESIEQLNPELQAGIKARLIEWRARATQAGIDIYAAEPDVRAYARAKLVCPLLDREAHRCLVYEARPLACRGHYLVNQSAKVCSERDENPTTTNLVVLPQVAKAVQALALVWSKGKSELRLAIGLLPQVLHHLWLEGGQKLRDKSVPQEFRHSP